MSNLFVLLIFTFTAGKVCASPSATSKKTDSIETEKFTDADFGFSFYYPKGWRLHKKEKGVGLQSEDDLFEIVEIAGSKVATNGLFGHDLFFFDSKQKKWNDEYEIGGDSEGEPIKGIREAKAVSYTLGGYPVFQGQSVHGQNALVIPLSGEKILMAFSPAGAGSIVHPIAGTIIKAGTTPDPAKFSTAVQAIQADRYYKQDICRKNDVPDIECASQSKK